jgi:hypothetical protein
MRRRTGRVADRASVSVEASILLAGSAIWKIASMIARNGRARMERAVYNGAR